MGNYYIYKFHKHKIGTIIKHIPGHGLAVVDSHKKLPIVNTDINEIYKKDFKPFKNKKSLLAMTAHVLYKKIDKYNCATHSKKIITLIRKRIGFKNLIISDDISMKALTYGLKNNAIKAIDAGCNLVLHWNGNIKEMSILAKIIPTIDNFTQKKTSHFYNFLG